VKDSKIQSLEDRSRVLLLRTIKLCKSVGETVLTKRIIPQLIACSGSIGANYLEASAAMSKKDFVKCLKIARKESREYLIWIDGLEEASGMPNEDFAFLKQEAKELSYILTSIISKNDSK